jgi:hypothetical protein
VSDVAVVEWVVAFHHNHHHHSYSQVVASPYPVAFHHRRSYRFRMAFASSYLVAHRSYTTFHLVPSYLEEQNNHFHPAGAHCCCCYCCCSRTMELHTACVAQREGEHPLHAKEAVNAQTNGSLQLVVEVVHRR